MKFCFIFQDVDAVLRRHFILQYTLRNLFHQVGKQQDLIYSRIGHIVFCDKQHKETDILQAESQVGFGMCDWYQDACDGIHHWRTCVPVHR